MNRFKKWASIVLGAALSVGLHSATLADGVMPKMPEPPTTPVYWQLSEVSIEPTLNQISGYEVSYGDENVSVPLDDRLMTESLLESGEISAPSLRISAVRGDKALDQVYTWSAMPVYMEPNTSYEVTLNGESQSTSSNLGSWMGVYLQGETVGRLSAGGYANRPNTYTLEVNPTETELFEDGTLNVSFVLRDTNDMLRIRVLYAYEMVDGDRPYPTPIPGFVASEESPAVVPAFYVPVEGMDGLWTVSTAPEEYRAFGFMNGEGPSFFAADENGNVEMNAPVVTETEDYARHVEGFRTSSMGDEIPQGYTQIGENLYSFTSRDGQVSYRAYGFMNGEAPAFYPADETGTVAADAQSVDPAADYTEQIEGFGMADVLAVPGYFHANENGVYSFTDREGNTHYRVYGRLNGAEPAFYESDANGAVNADAKPVDPAEDFAAYVEGFDAAQPETIPEHYQQVGEGLYSFTTRDGETVYRTYGVLDGKEPAFYPADETGEPTGEEAVLPDADFEEHFAGFETREPGDALPDFYQPTEIEGIWAFENADGEMQYRIYGSKDRQEAAFYPCDQDGNMTDGALPVLAAADLATLPVPSLIPAVPAEDQVVDFYTLIDAEKGLYAFTGRDGQTEYRVFGAQEEGGEAAYYPADENGDVKYGTTAIDSAEDYENHIVGFESKTPDVQQIPASYEVIRDGLYSFENEQGEKVYRAYGSLNRGEPAFYESDETGVVATDAVAVVDEKENDQQVNEVVPAETEEAAETVSRSYPVENEQSTETEAPVETDAPAETEAPVETDAPAETEAPVETDAPAETEAPVETDVPAETDAPAETEAPAETDAPAETEAPAETDAPAVTEVPADTEAPVETESPAETEEPVTASTSEPVQTEEEKEHWIWIVIGAAAAALGISGGTVAAVKKKAKKK